MNRLLRVMFLGVAGAGVLVCLVLFLGGQREAEVPDKGEVAEADRPRMPARLSDSVSVAMPGSVLPPDDPASMHPVEAEVARGVVLESRVLPGDRPGEWRRERLAKVSAQSQPVLVVERWVAPGDDGVPRNLAREMFRPDRAIVNLAPLAEVESVRGRLAELGFTQVEDLGAGRWVVGVPVATLADYDTAMRALAGMSVWLASTESDGVGFGGAMPNDSWFGQQWGLHNIGQFSGTADADTNAPEMWDILGGAPGVVVAVLDSGLAFTHPDLQGVSWTNSDEIPGDGRDNDGNGRIDDVRGWDFVGNDSDPTDDHGHGSHVSGVIAARRNNGAGVAGLLDGVRILSCKILNAQNSGLTSNLIAATTYARLKGCRLMNLSLQNYPYSGTLWTEFEACRTAGITLIICAGNQGANNDQTPNYPSSYTHENIIAVANHDRTGARWAGSFAPSNYGATSVDLFAPGRDIYSTVLFGGYEAWTGTSMSTPHVSAACAALLYVNPDWSAVEIKACVQGAARVRTDYAGLCVTGARLDLPATLGRAFRARPTADADADGSSNLLEYLAGTGVDVATRVPRPTYRAENGWFSMNLPRVMRAEGVLVVERSTDLRTWTTSGVSVTNGATELLGQVALSGEPRVFLRIKAVPVP